MWLINLIDLKNRVGMTSKQIAEIANVAEKSVSNVFFGKSKSPSINLVRRIITALGGSVREVFDESDAVIGSQDLAKLQEEADRITAENEKMRADLAELRDKVVTLTTENDILRMQLKHKEEIIALHNYYNKLKSND